VTGPDAGLAGVFRDETTGRLDEMDAALMAAESGEAAAGTVGSLFRNAHSIKGAAGMLGYDDIRALAHAAEDVLAAVRDAGVFPAGLAALLLRATSALRALVSGAGEPIDGLLTDLAAGRASVTGGRALPPQPPPSPQPPRGPAQPGAGQRPGPVPATAGRRTLRVPAGKIDHLLDVVGEVMQDRTRLAHSLSGAGGPARDAAAVLEAGERMLDELKDTAVGLRTLPLASITGPLPRAVRDLARQAGRDAELTITGGDTELDRVNLESLSEPLAHLLRNAVSHGIEPAAERARAGKAGRGRIELRAVPRGSLVEIAVADDGRGVSPEVAEQAREEGSLTDLLTRPGYTTAAGVTDTAGRGVGLDAVRSTVVSLGGSLDVRSEPGHGMTVSLLLPLALALLEVLLCERGGGVYGLPLAAVQEAAVVTGTLSLQNQPALEVRGRALPVADLAALIGADAPPLPRGAPALVVSAAGRRAVISCDAVRGQAEVVVKPLGPLLARVPGYLGAAVLGDGRIALLLEPATLIRGTTRAATAPAAPAVAPAPAVLVVEDSFTVRELQRSILEAAGYPVVTARDGRDALSALRERPDIGLVITDLEMPELDGLALTRAIRGDPERASLPVVIVTSHGSEDDRREGIEAGADAYVVKRDFDQQALLATVERLTGR
jgi:two-component system chemotaxis sensor kinase CheA